MTKEQMIKKTIYVEPAGKARARTVRHGDRVMTFTPAKTVHLENQIREKMMELEAFFPKECPLYMKVTFFRSRPKTAKKSVRLPVTKPDLDNYWKLLKDALQYFVYANDSQITTALVKKRFGSPPRIELEIKEDME